MELQDERRERFREMFLAHQRAVIAYSARRSSPPGDFHAAEDITSSVFMIAWRRLDDIGPDPLPWLLVTAKNVMAENRRGDGRRARRERAHTIDRALARDHLVDPVAGVADALAVRAVLERLSDNDRELAMLLAWDDLTLIRAAQVLGITPEAARTRWKRLRSRLAIALAAPLDSLGDELPSEGSIAFSSGHLDLETPA